MRSFFMAVLTLAISAICCAASATEFPTRPMEIVVPFPPGGNTDLLARLLADGLQRELKQPVAVVNKPGAGTNIGAGYVARSNPDGYTMLISAPASFVVNQFLYPSLPYDPDHSFSPVSLVAQFPNVLVVHPSVPAKSVSQFIQLAKAKPGTTIRASSCVCGLRHMRLLVPGLGVGGRGRDS